MPSYLIKTQYAISVNNIIPHSSLSVSVSVTAKRTLNERQQQQQQQKHNQRMFYANCILCHFHIINSEIKQLCATKIEMRRSGGAGDGGDGRTGKKASSECIAKRKLYIEKGKIC